MVHSNIHLEEPPGFLTLKTRKAVSDALACLGKDRRTRGSLLFKFSPLPPTWMQASGFEKEMREKKENYQKLQNEKDERDKKKY